MNNRKSIVAASALVALSLLAIGAFWVMAGPNSEPSGRVVVGQEPSVPATLAQLQDVARDPIALDRTDPIPITVYQDPLCGCCGAWVEHIIGHGFEPDVQYHNDLQEVKRTFGVRPELSSCHTAVVNGYVVEGHVPGEVMRRFLAEAPAARGLAVPGMPIGSPGMEVPDGRVARYDVILFTNSGEARVYSSHGPSASGG
jgi:hypothetical protein